MEERRELVTTARDKMKTPWQVILSRFVHVHFREEEGEGEIAKVRILMILERSSF